MYRILTIAYSSCSLPLAYFVNRNAHHELLLLCFVSCRNHNIIAMNEIKLMPCGQECMYSAMKSYLAKHCSPCCGK